jgi:molybdopterin-guanine dinucleotide biosynthesis protein A
MSQDDAAEYARRDITGVILAGGRGQRMGGVDKGLIPLAGKPMVTYVLGALRPQVATILISANRNLDQYAAFGCQVATDTVGEYHGPLAGVASAMEIAETRYVITVPCDSPLVAHDLVARLYRALSQENAEISVAHDGERMHPVFALLRCDLLSSLQEYLQSGQRKIDRWFAHHKLVIAYFTDEPDTFVNVNNPEERAAIATRLSQVRTC